MSTKTLETLKAGLAKLKEQVKVCQGSFLKHLHEKKPILDVDEQWLDHEGNLVNEEKVLKVLENASDYEHGLERLNTQDKTLVEKLKEVGGGIVKWRVTAVMTQM
ncbi:hypothetical protein H0H87_012806, partial [Tephrocybe sp. NHM501043]